MAQYNDEQQYQLDKMCTFCSNSRRHCLETTSIPSSATSSSYRFMKAVTSYSHYNKGFHSLATFLLLCIIFSADNENYKIYVRPHACPPATAKYSPAHVCTSANYYLNWKKQSAIWIQAVSTFTWSPYVRKKINSNQTHTLVELPSLRWDKIYIILLRKATSKFLLKSFRASDAFSILPELHALFLTHHYFI